MIWEDSDKKQTLKQYGIYLIKSECEPENAKDLKLPSNSFLVTINHDGHVFHDIVQCYNASTAFDAYYDKFGKMSVVSIVNTAGQVNPKVYGFKPVDKKRRNS